jgi:hypothetical protein
MVFPVDAGSRFVRFAFAMKLKSFLQLFVVGALFPLSLLAVPVTTLTSYFDDSRWIVENRPLDLHNIVGTGVMSYYGGPLADGVYDYVSFSGLTMTFIFNGDISFTEADLQTDLDSVDLKILIVGTTFQFLAASNGEQSGSAEWLNGDGLIFAVSPDVVYPDFEYVVEVHGSPGAGYIYAGIYGVGTVAVPEPSTYAAIASAIVLVSTIVIRRQRVRSEVEQL